ncbi:MAG: nitroreductase family protein, partial [Marinoscillum sp.]
VNESVGIACGMLITAIHNTGLVTLTHTPSPMNFLTSILERPSNERPFLLLPVGYPEQDIYVPDLERKQLDAVSVFYK